MIIWRSLLDAIQVPWRDRGSNCSRGHVNIRCPWCGNMDPSHHLAINEETGAYYCMRTPGSTHSGRSAPWLLLGLGVHPSEIDGLIDDHSDRRRPRTLVAVPERIVEWDRFERASDSPAALDYLASRGYRDPRWIANFFDLRFTRVGRFSWRILMPLRCPGDQGQVLAFTGRAAHNQQPRYLTNDPMGGSLYCPSRPGDVVVAALQGTSLPAEKKLHIAQLSRQARLLVMVEGPFDALTLALGGFPAAASGVYYVPDADQSVSDTYRLIEELEGIPGMPHIQRLVLPSGFKDVGQMAGREGEISQWLKQLTSRSGGDRSRIMRGAS